MPEFNIFDPRTNRNHTITAERAPNEQEALEYISSLPVKASPTAEQDAFTQQFIAQGSKNKLSQALETLTAGPRFQLNLAKGVYETAKQGAEGLGTVLGGPNAAGNTAQTGFNVIPQLAYDIGNALRQGSQFAINEPGRVLQNIAAASNPVGSALTTLILGNVPTTQQEAQRAYERQLANQAYQEIGEGGIAPEILGEANVPLSRAIPLLLGAGAIRGGIAGARAIPAQFSKMVSRVKPTNVESVMSALNVPIEDAKNIITSGFPRVIETAGKIPEGATETLSIIPKAKANLFREATDVWNSAGETGLRVNQGSAVDEAIAAINSNSRWVQDNPQQAAKLIQRYEKYREQALPLDGQKVLVDTNENLTSHYNKTAKGQASDMTDAEVRSEKAFALNLGNQLDEIYKATSGIDASPYRDIGNLIELENNLRLRLKGLEKSEAARKAPIETATSKLPGSRLQALGQVKTTALTPLKSTSLENLDRTLKTSFREAPSPNYLPLSANERSALAQKYTLTTPPPIPANALNNQLQQAIEASRLGEVP